MEIKTLEGTDLKEILNIFNKSFSDYYIPFKLTKKQLSLKMLADKTNLKLSVGAFENGNLISFILHGFDTINNQKVAYNAGTGVIPEKRGIGLTKKMYRFVLPLLIEKEINKVILEVIDKNIQAIKSYEKTGFRTKRELVCYHGNIKIIATNKDLELKKLQKYDWNTMRAFWDILPTWQNSINVLNSFKSTNILLGGYIKNQLVGYVIYNADIKRILQIAVGQNFRKKQIASTLISELTKKYGNKLSVINVDKSSKSTLEFFSKIGLEKNLEQLEMELNLNK
ncbi:GNAT family N-acetyltransferase [Aquimarina rubra]|uniref:GNAT family N-acetyltransferase n=1 Tax=Aquimarina rubra TaxID=1920033 RepID=A0ABW5LA95_9FLAO